MKKIIAISFMLSFLLANTEARELLKLPVLLHHYFEHHDEHEGVSFLEFLHKHYSEHHQHSSSNNEHEKLPFKSHDAGLHVSSVFLRTPLLLPEFFPQLPPQKNSSFSTNFSPSPFLSLIWQPPRSC